MIQDTLSKVVYTADGLQRQWDIPFQFNNKEDLHIYLTEDGVRVDEVFQNFEFVEAGNYVIYPTEESGLAPLEAGKQILILRETPNTQLEDASEIYFKSKDIERGLDKLTMQVQELARDSYRAVKVSHFDTISPEDFTETLFETGAQAEAAAAAAATSASNASLSEQNAASSKLSAEQASASATASAELAQSAANNSLQYAERAESAAAGSAASASSSAESASLAQDLLNQVSESIYSKPEIDAKVSGLQAEIDLVESYIPSGTNDTNTLVNKQQLLDEEMDIREDLNEGLSELQTQITAQAAAITNKQEKLVAGENITIDGNVISATGGGGGGGTEVEPATEEKAGIISISTSEEAREGFDDTTAMTPLKTAQVIYDNIGRAIQLGFDGTLSGNVLTFEPDTDTAYELKTGYNYTIDLLFPAVVADGTLDENISMVINNNGESIKIVNALNDDVDTDITVGNMKQIMKYTTDIGFRWIFNARFTTTQDGTKVFVMPSTVVNVQGGELPDNVYTEDNLIAGENITFSEVLPEGGIDEHTLACWHFDNYTTDSVNSFSLYGVGSLDKSYSKFGEGSCHFVTTYTSSDISQIGINPTKTSITADFWVKAVGSNSNPKVGFGSYSRPVLALYVQQDNIVLTGTAWSDASVDLGVVPGADFNHYALQYDKDKNTAALFFNGKKIVEQNVAIELAATSFNDFVTYSYYQARIDELRISDMLRYDGDFTPPTEPYTLATGPSKKAINAVIPEVELPDTVYTQDNLVAGDNIEIKEVVNPNVIDNNTLLCWHFDGDTKDVVNGEDFTLYPDYGALNTTYYKFGSGSAPDYVQNGLNIALGETLTDQTDFTVDYWIKGVGADVSTLSFASRFIGNNYTDIYFRAFGNDSNLLDVSDSNGNAVGSLSKQNTISTADWSHWAFTYNKETRDFTVYANGVKQGSLNVPVDNTFEIASFYPVHINYNQFLIDELRITKSLAWEKDFTPPTEAYAEGEGVAKKAISAIIPPVELPSDLYRQSNLLGGNNIEIVPEPVEGGIDEYTLSCFHLDGTAVDEVTGYTLNPTMDNGVHKFGTGSSMWVNSTSFPWSLNSYESFSFDYWYYHKTSRSSYLGLKKTAYISYVLGLYFNSAATKPNFYILSNKHSIDVDFEQNKWTHVYVYYNAEDRSFHLFINGKEVFSLIDSTDFSGVKEFSNDGYTDSRFDEIRISKCIRWTEDFTPPTQPYRLAEPTGNMVINGATKTSQLKNDSAFISGDGVLVVKKITQEEYDALETKDENTLYILA